MTTPDDIDPPAPSLASQTARGVIWMVLFKLAVRSLSLVSTLILVRLLSPEDFGLVAMAMVFIAILDTLSSFSFDVVLIANQDAGREEYDTAWTFNIIFKTASMLVLLALAYPAALYYDEPRVTVLMAVLAVGQFASGFINIGTVNFRKRMEFDKEFRYMFLSKVAGFLVTVPLAFILRNYWALIIGQIVNQFAQVALSFGMDAYRPRFRLSAWRGLFNFSKWLIYCNICGAVRQRATELIIGRASGPRGLGFFNISLELSNTPTTELIAPINRAVFPAYARISNDLATLRTGYLKVISIISLIALPAALGIAATAPLIVPVALGEKWLPTIPLFVVLSFTGAVASLQTNIQSVYFALGRPKVLALIQTMNMLAVIAAVIPATRAAGIEGAALAFFGATVLLSPITFAILLNDLKLSVRAFLGELWRPVFGSILMYAVTAYLTDWLIASNHGLATLASLVLAIAAGAVIYTLTILILWALSRRPEGAESYILAILTNRWAQFRASRRPNPSP
ncbi:MAG: lipopolysaccharide biosynthesis protein [Pseudomonadota bacterium]